MKWLSSWELFFTTQSSTKRRGGALFKCISDRGGLKKKGGGESLDALCAVTRQLDH